MIAKLTPIGAVCACLACTNVCSAQATTDAQSFRLNVPGLISINAINETATIIHDLRERDQRFPWQLWQVTSQNAAGAIVTFQSDQAFTHTTQTTSKRDVRIQLGARRAPRWRITQRRDQTDYKAGDETAIVRAESDQPGSGEFRLRVTFIEETLDTLQSGDYEVTIIGTLVPK